MSDIAQSRTVAAPQGPGLWSRLMAHIARVNGAHAHQLRFSPAMDEVSRDCGMPVEDVLGENAYDPALPFFFQRGFDRT